MCVSDSESICKCVSMLVYVPVYLCLGSMSVPRSCRLMHCLSECVCEVCGYVSLCVIRVSHTMWLGLFFVSSLLFVKYLTNGHGGKFCHFCGAKPPWLLSSSSALKVLLVRHVCYANLPE